MYGLHDFDAEDIECLYGYGLFVLSINERLLLHKVGFVMGLH